MSTDVQVFISKGCFELIMPDYLRDYDFDTNHAVFRACKNVMSQQSKGLNLNRVKSPGQLRIPPLKGTNAHVCLPFEFSGENLSGMNFSGSIQYFGSL